MTLALPQALAGVTTGATDPIRYYTRPGIGWVFRRRIEMGLEMIPPMPPGARALEVGYAAGIVLYNLASRVSVTSRDEFEELGASFNAMAVELGRQFQALSTAAELASIHRNEYEVFRKAVQEDGIKFD